MFTKCPECQIAFRVTARVLQQAAGNVRCGQCGHTFSALAYLSEEMPDVAETPGGGTQGSGDNKLAETSRRLLETLDELAGPEEVRIEDTGLEWRVLDEEEEKEQAAEPVLTGSAADEIRYDDNTPLPEGFDDKDEAAYTPPVPPQRRTTDYGEPSEEFADRQGDLALSEPEDWTDLLDEVRDPQADSLEVEEELAAIHTQLSAREERPEPVPVDLDTQFETQAEAMGLDLASSEEALTDEVPLLHEADIDAAVRGEEVADEISDEIEEAPAAAAETTGLAEAAQPADDVAAQDDFVIEDALPEGVGELDDLTAEEEADIRDLIAGREPTGEFEAQIEAAARALAGEDEADEHDAEIAAEDEAEDFDFRPTEPEEYADAEDTAAAEDEAVAGADEEELESDIAEDDGETSADHAKFVVLPPTEDEMTLNMEIDQELMAAAAPDDDFTATLVGIKDPQQLFDENAADVETIVMEGEFVQSAIEKERLDAETAAKSQLDDPGGLADTYAMNRNKVRGGRRKGDPPGFGIIAAVVLLALLLAAQFVHNSRESLATFGFFNQTIAPVYRVLGNPVTPEWDIKGWQFEATNGSVDDNGTALTIVSRLANRSEQPLPYPLVHVSLTDRWEDIMGSRILEPAEYLAGDLDPSKPVTPGDTFNAVITIEEPSVDATGFKLNVCYRVEPGRVRCAIEDFKN